MHKKVLELGPEIFEKFEEYKEKKHDEEVSRTERKSRKIFNKQLEDELHVANHKHQDVLKCWQKELTTEVNKTLFNEATIIREKKYHVYHERQKKIKSNGKRELATALLKANDDFDVEKSEAIDVKIVELNLMAKESEVKKQSEHEDEIGRVNLEWKKKVEDLKEIQKQKTMEALLPIYLKVSAVEKELNDTLNATVNTRLRQNESERNLLKEKLNVEENTNVLLEKQLSKMENKSKHINSITEAVLESMKLFIISTTGIDEREISHIIDGLKI